MFGALLGEYAALLATLVISLVLVRIIVFAFTFGRGPRPFISAIHVRDFNPTASRRYVRIRRVIGVLHLVTILGLVITFCVLLGRGFSGSQMGVISTILGSSCPAAYFLTYLRLATKRYSDAKSVLPRSWVWGDALGDEYIPVLREVRVIDASCIASAAYPVFIAVVPFVWSISNLVSSPSSSSVRDMLSAVAVEFIAIAVGFLTIFLFSAADRAVPYRRVISRSVSLLLLLEDRHPGSGGLLVRRFKSVANFLSLSPVSFSPTRWRTSTHKAGFDLASSLEKTALALRKRLSKDSFEKCYGECAKLSSLLKGKAIEAGSPEVKEGYAEMVRCALAVVAADNPERVLPYTRKMTFNESEMTPPSGRLLLLLGTLNEHAQQAWGTIRVAGALVAVTVVIVYGRWEDLGKYFLQ